MGVARRNPYASFSFRLSFGGDGAGADAEGGFSDITGLDVGPAGSDYRESVAADLHVRKAPGLHKHSTLTLKRGLVDARGLQTWLDDAQHGRGAARRTVTIRLHDAHARAVATWRLSRAFPVKVVGPELSGAGNEVAIEELELSHEGLAKEP